MGRDGPGRAGRRQTPAQASFSPQPPRPCEAYSAEWKLCRSAGHFLHHYYVHGERPACEQWRRDLASCREWEERRSAEAQVRPGGREAGALRRRVHGRGVRVRGPGPPTFQAPGLERSTAGALHLFVLPFEKYQKLVCQRGVQTAKAKARGA